MQSQSSQREKYNIGVIGSGSEGSALIRRLCKLHDGQNICVSHAGSPEELKPLESECGVKPKETTEVVKNADLVFLCIPMKDVHHLPKGLFNNCTMDCIIVDTCNYYPHRDGRIKELDDGMPESQYVSQNIGKPVIKAFNNILAKALEEGMDGKVCLPVSGDDSRGKTKVIKLIETMGFDAYDAGSLHQSWRQQPGSPAYCTNLDRAGLQRALEQANKEKMPELREQAYQKMKASDRQLDWRSIVELLRETYGVTGPKEEAPTLSSMVMGAMGMEGQKGQGHQGPGIAEKIKSALGMQGHQQQEQQQQQAQPQ